MEAIFSKLRTIDFRVLESSIITIEQPNQKMDLVDLSKCLVEIDFSKAAMIQKNGVFALHIDCSVNSSKELGYSIALKAVGIFQVDEDNLEKSELINLKTISPLSLMIGNVRGFLRDITSYGIYGAYQLPSIDIVHIVNGSVAKTTKQANAKLK